MNMTIGLPLRHCIKHFVIESIHVKHEQKEAKRDTRWEFTSSSSSSTQSLRDRYAVAAASVTCEGVHAG
jgi:hypothetical protein